MDTYHHMSIDSSSYSGKARIESAFLEIGPREINRIDKPLGCDFVQERPQIFLKLMRDPILTTHSIFIYLLLAAILGGTLLFIYNTWIKTLFPQTKGRGKGGERARTSTQGKKPAVTPAEQVSVLGADGPAVTTASSRTFDSAWIPANHLQRPEAKRIRSGPPKAKPKP